MMTCYPYCEQTDQHYLIVKKNDGTVFDENYNYLDESFKFKFIRFWTKVATVIAAFPLMRIRTLLKIKGKQNIRKNKKALKQGCISVVNHVHIWDFIGVMDALTPFVPYIPVWDKNMRGENKGLIRYNNGIPVPTGNIHATHAFSQTINNLLQRGEWVHFSAEGSMWEYYQPVRPFKKGAFVFAVHNNKPVVPLGYSFRQPKGLQKLFWKKPLLTLSIGEPIFPDTSLPYAKAVDKLTKEAHAAVCRLCGIEDGTNIYPPIFNNNKRIDYYPLNKDEVEKAPQ